MDIALEVSLYIERFHNLDLWQQGWYALKVTCAWEGNDREAGIPTRVVQYEGASDGLSTVWHISDTDHSFCTRPFKIKYARQDVFLAMMVSFSLAFKSVEEILNSSALIKFHLLFAPLDGFLFFNSMHMELPTVASHCYRLSPRAVHGAHAYCPLHFDASHMALVDVFVHTVILSTSHHEIEPLHAATEGNSLKSVEVHKVLLSSRNALVSLLNAFGSIEQLQEEITGNKGASQELEDQLSGLWNLFMKLHRENKDFFCTSLRNSWNQERYAHCLMWVRHSELTGTRESEDKWAVNRAEIHRKSLMQTPIGCDFEDMHLFGRPSQQPIIFVEHEQIGDAEETSGRGIDELRLVIFVHGFQGHHLDLRLVRNHWLLADPEAEVLMSLANEERTSGDLSELGGRLADEAAEFLKSRMSKPRKYGAYRNFKISFVGHSIGNLIIRAALMETSFQPYLKYLYTFLSISGPHLGYLYSSNPLFNSGLWILKKWKGSALMHQLTFSDKTNIEDSFLFKLSQAKTFELFQNVILLSSPQDRYVPYHSARIEMCQAALRDAKRGPAFAVMLHNCLLQLKTPSPLRQRNLIRCDVNFDISSQARTFNAFIGRTAHIEFLETDAFIRFIIWTFPKCFT
ncbi:uncharacterized protein LOC9659903 [Selaginella moellendorffii]|uniref:uncharacterized protein LOC9659903 n=1 Tax=Selaginella moellendorffii TaxID=88036 RepID=UPI000D1D0229|nr:uncharacterized protein LOC9659903 [Selaginella moellendorffii]|eukprot:XP_024525450.1 uncharacterized protein LOC9659903 [Selaginella moellendorffii]